MNLNEYFQNNYNEVLEWATRIYRKSEIDPRDVVAELYIDINKPQRQLPTQESQMKFWILRWMKNMTYWEGGNPIKKHKVSDRSSDNTFLIDMHVYDMESDEVTRDLKSCGFDPSSIDKIVSCIEVSKGMPLYYKRLFVLYYIDGMTMDEIGKSCGLPKSAIFTQIKKVQGYLKSKLKLNSEVTLL